MRRWQFAFADLLFDLQALASADGSGRVASGPYARWCVTRMVTDAVRRFGLVG